MSGRRSTLAALLLTTSLVVGCGDEGPPNPAPLAAAPDAGDPGVGGSPPTPVPVKRTIETRNPWGGVPGNLLIDGDFEFSIVIDGEYPQSGWHAYSFGGSLRYLRGETGGLCKSGMRCAVLEAGRLMMGDGTAANGSEMVGGFWVKPPPERACDEVLTAYFIYCKRNSNFATPVVSDTLLPASDGWCHYSATIGLRDSAICLYIESDLQGTETALVDGATLLPVDAAMTTRSAQTAPPQTLSAARAERLQRLRKVRRDTLPLGAAAPSKVPRIVP